MELKDCVIKHEGAKWVLYSHDGSKTLGTFDSEEEAKKREAQINAFKHANAGSVYMKSEGDWCCKYPDGHVKCGFKDEASAKKAMGMGGEAPGEMRSYSRELAAKASGKIRTEKFLGRDHLVIPVTALVEGVIHASNAETPELVLAEEFEKNVSAWNGRPVMLDHPKINGEPVSANDPRVMDQFQIGHVFNARVDGKRLLMDAYIDATRLEALGETGQQMLAHLKAGNTNEVSVGTYVHAENKSGKLGDQLFKAVWRDITSDHLAFLPLGMNGACSVEMGCGAQRAASAVVYEIAGDKEGHEFHGNQYSSGGGGGGKNLDAIAEKANNLTSKADRMDSGSASSGEVGKAHAEAFKAHKEAERAFRKDQADADADAHAEQAQLHQDRAEQMGVSVKDDSADDGGDSGDDTLPSMKSDRDIADVLDEGLGGLGSSTSLGYLGAGEGFGLKAESQKDAIDKVEEFIDEELFTFRGPIRRMETFEEAGIMTTDPGLVLTMSDGAEYQISAALTSTPGRVVVDVKKSRNKRRGAARRAYRRKKVSSAADCGCGGTKIHHASAEEVSMEKKARVAALIASGKTCFKAADAAALEQLSDEAITGLEKKLEESTKAPEAPAIPAEVQSLIDAAKADAEKTPEQKREEFFKANPDVDEIVKTHKAASAARRASLVEDLKKHQKTYSEAELNELPTAQLEKLAQLVSRPRADFSGQATRAASQGEEVESAPKPIDMKARVLAMHGKSKS